MQILNILNLNPYRTEIFYFSIPLTTLLSLCKRIGPVPAFSCPYIELLLGMILGSLESTRLLHFSCVVSKHPVSNHNSINYTHAKHAPIYC